MSTRLQKDPNIVYGKYLPPPNAQTRVERKGQYVTFTLHTDVGVTANVTERLDTKTSRNYFMLVTNEDGTREVSALYIGEPHDDFFVEIIEALTPTPPFNCVRSEDFLSMFKAIFVEQAPSFTIP